MDEGATRLSGLREGVSDWDGRFLLVNVMVPESARQLRHVVRTRLTWFGFAPISSGLWVSTKLGAEPSVRELLSDLELDAYSFIGTAGSIGDLDKLIRDAWHLGDLAAEYRAFMAAFEALRPSTPDEYFLDYLQLVHHWRRFPLIDPALPDDLLPVPWIGRKAANFTHTMSELWGPLAKERWRKIVAEAT